MPSCQFFDRSGGIPLVSGDIFSGLPYPIGGVQLVWDKAAPGPIYVGASGTPTFLSGGVFSSGGLADGVKLNPGDGWFFAKSTLYNLSGRQRIDAVQMIGPAASSGGIMFWYSV